MESLSSAASSAADSSPSTGSPPAPLCPGEEEALSTALALCRVSASAAIDRRSFIATGLAAELLEGLLSQRLPEPDDGSPKERGCASLTASPSLERLRRHNRAFRRAMESFQEPAWAPVEAPVCAGQRRCQAQPYGHLCCDPAWHGAHGCCAHVEPVPGVGHQRGLNPGPAAPTRSETSCSRQCRKHQSSPRDVRLAPGAGAIVSHELGQCRCGTWAAGREPHGEPELNRQPCSQEGLTMSLQCRDAEPEPGPGCGCALALKRPRQDMGWRQQEREAPVPGSCCWQPRAAGAANMVQVIARSFELRAHQDPAVPMPAPSRRGKAGPRDGACS